MDQTVSYEAVKQRGTKIAQIAGISPDEATLKLIHKLGYQNVDFSGGVRSRPDKETTKLTTTAS